MTGTAMPLSATDRRYDRDFSSKTDWGCQSTGVPDVFIADKDVDVFTDLPLFGCNTIANPRIQCP
jgi:hypothetical protein